MKLRIYYVQYEKGDNHPGQFNIVCQRCGTCFSGMAFHFADFLRNARSHRCPDIIGVINFSEIAPWGKVLEKLSQDGDK